MKSLNFALVAISAILPGLFNFVVAAGIPTGPPFSTTSSHTQSGHTHKPTPVPAHTGVWSEVTEHSKHLSHCTSSPCLAITRGVDVRVDDEADLMSFRSRDFTHLTHTRTHSFGSVGLTRPGHHGSYWQPQTTNGVHTSYVMSDFQPEYTDSTWIRPSVPSFHLPLEDRAEMHPNGAHTATHPEHTHSSMHSEPSHTHGTPHQEPTLSHEHISHSSESRHHRPSFIGATHTPIHPREEDDLAQFSRRSHSEWSTRSHQHEQTMTRSHPTSSVVHPGIGGLSETWILPRDDAENAYHPDHTHWTHSAPSTVNMYHPAHRPTFTESMHPTRTEPILPHSDEDVNPDGPRHCPKCEEGSHCVFVHDGSHIGVCAADHPLPVVDARSEDASSDESYIPCDDGRCPGSLTCYGYDAYFVGVCLETSSPKARAVPAAHQVHCTAINVSQLDETPILENFCAPPLQIENLHDGSCICVEHAKFIVSGPCVDNNSCGTPRVPQHLPPIPHLLPNGTCLCVTYPGGGNGEPLPITITHGPGPITTTGHSSNTLHSTSIPAFLPGPVALPGASTISTGWFSVHVTSLTTFSTQTYVTFRFNPTPNLSMSLAKREQAAWTPTITEGGSPATAMTLNPAHPKPSKSTISALYNLSNI